MISLTTLDYIIIFSLFSVILFIGFYVGKASGKNTNQYFLSGRNMPWWLLGVSMVATTFSTDTPNLVTDIVRTQGVSGNWVWWAFLITGLLTVFVYAKLWRKSEVKTDIEFYELRYGGKPARFLRGFRAVYLGVIFNVLAMAGVTLAAIKIGQVMLGLPPVATVLVAGFITVIFSAIGGFKGVVYTDFILFFVAMAGAFGAAYYIISIPEIGGLEALITHENVKDKINILPRFDDMDTLITLLIIPLAVQWWSSWYPGAEPGGGGYVAQRMLAAKDENHAIGATFFFNFMHYALRPWPWILVASGLLGLVLASLSAAYMSTISTHLNWGASYVVNDFYKQQIKTDASEKHLVNVGRITTIILMIASALIALALTNALQLFDIILMFGAGTGLIFILRWFWWRINAWTEISAMIASGVISIAFILTPLGDIIFGAEGFLPAYMRFPLVVILSTIIWLLVTYLTTPESKQVLRRFYKKTQPGGPGWKKIVDEADKENVSIVATSEKWSVPNGILAMLLGCITIYSCLFAVGYFLYGEYFKAIVLSVVVLIMAFLLKSIWGKIKGNII